MGSHKTEFEPLHKKQMELFDSQIKSIKNNIAKNKKITSYIVQYFSDQVDKGLKDLQNTHSLKHRLSEDYCPSYKQQ